LRKDLEGALREDPGLAAGVYLYRGRMVNEKVGVILGIPATPVTELIERK
jgi:alanine dehydrogenase